MMDSPASITGQALFPHKAEVASALAAGAHVRRDERNLVANAMLGIYQIRLRIAQDAKPTSEHTQQAVQDLSFLVAQLGQHPNARVVVWYIHAPNGTRYTLMEAEQSAVPLGCISGAV